MPRNGGCPCRADDDRRREGKQVDRCHEGGEIVTPLRHPRHAIDTSDAYPAVSLHSTARLERVMRQVRLVLALTFILFVTNAVAAQERGGTITGIVTDAAHHALPGARVDV